MQIAKRIMERLGWAEPLHQDAFGHRLDTLCLSTPDSRARRGRAARPHPSVFGARRAVA